jgi:hypothetical protein
MPVKRHYTSKGFEYSPDNVVKAVKPMSLQGANPCTLDKAISF